jgi:hypothetical protein
MHLLQLIITTTKWVRQDNSSWVLVSVPTLFILIRVGEDQLVQGSRRGILLFILVKDRPDRMLSLLLLLQLLIVVSVEKDEVLLRGLNSLGLYRGTTSIVMKGPEVACGTCLAHF